MELIQEFIDLLLKLHRHLLAIEADYKGWVYLTPFLIIICETALAVVPFLTAYSVIFTAATNAAIGTMIISLIAVIIGVAAMLSHSVNDSINKFFATNAFEINFRFRKKTFLLQSNSTFVKHRHKINAIARFAPIVFTFAPIVAGKERIYYHQFIQHNISGAILWILTCSFAFDFFAKIPILNTVNSIVMIGISVILTLSIAISFLRMRYLKYII